jgi:S1-C subfamily serine protease
MKVLKSFLIFVLIFVVNQHVLAEVSTVNSVVKIFTTKSTHDYKYPWEISRFKNTSGSGTIIKDNKILTAAHVISYSSFIEVQKEGNPKKFKAEIEFVSHQADLAVLKVVDETFFKDTTPLSLNPLVKHRDPVTVYGFPVGGNAISITEGVVSRIEYQQYVYSKESLLAIQIDAAINLGNSGGPAVDKNGQLIGIAMQGYQNANSIGYIVPSILIQAFLKDTEDHEVNGFHLDQNIVRAIQNLSMNQKYGLNDGDGVLVTAIQAGENQLRIGDVLLAVDGKPIANDGSIETKMGRIEYSLAFHTKQFGESVRLKVLRDKKIVEIDYLLGYTKPLIAKEFDSKPRYFIFGGLAFSPMTKNYLNSIDMKDNAIDMLFYGRLADKELTEPVVWIQAIFPHEVNRGYSSGANVVKTVNGQNVRSFKHFVELIEESSDEFITIDFMTNKTVVLDREKAISATSEVESSFGVISDRRL